MIYFVPKHCTSVNVCTTTADVPTVGAEPPAYFGAAADTILVGVVSTAEADVQ